MIEVIRAERDRRETCLPQDPDVACHITQVVDEPFINELCLVVLVSLHHQVERELLLAVERVPKKKQREISIAQYRANVEKRRSLLRQQKGTAWEKLYKELGVQDGEPTYLETLRLLANAYKHHPFMLPQAKLLELLNLPKQRKSGKRVLYAPLSESRLLQEGLAAAVGLPKIADYCDIAQQFADKVIQFLASLKTRATMPFVRDRVSMNPENFEN